jgi:hypothetical protein
LYGRLFELELTIFLKYNAFFATLNFFAELNFVRCDLRGVAHGLVDDSTSQSWVWLAFSGIFPE